MDNAAVLVLEIDPETDGEFIDILLKFKKDFEDVFNIENFKDSLIRYKHV